MNMLIYITFTLRDLTLDMQKTDNEQVGTPITTMYLYFNFDVTVKARLFTLLLDTNTQKHSCKGFKRR